LIIYSELSRFVHPSIEESRRWIEYTPPKELVDSMKFNRFDGDLLTQTIGKCKEVGRLLISIDEYFVREYLSKISSR
jgi:hypothetical protein